MFHLRKMSTSNDATISTPVTNNTLSSSVFNNMYMVADIFIFSITTFYFYRKINSLNYQLKEMDTKIQQLEKTIAEQKTFITDKMAEMSSIVTNMLRQQQSRPPIYAQPVYQPQQTNTQPSQPVYTQPPVQQNLTQQPVYQQQQTNTQPIYVQTPVQQNFTQNQGYNQTQTQPVQQFVPQNTTQQTVQTPPPQQTLSPSKQNSPQPSTQNNAPYIPFEVIMVDMSATPNSNSNSTKMTIEEDEDDELDRELSAELDELKE